MTLILSLASKHRVCVAADRRVTSNGQLVEDEQNKICVLLCDDARVAFAFTGLATFGNFSTQEWLSGALLEIGKNHHTVYEILCQLLQRVNTDLAKIPAQHRVLCIVCAGFVHWDTESTHFTCNISNLGQPAAGAPFKLATHNMSPPSVMSFGSSSLSLRQREALVRVLSSGADKYHLIHAGIRTMRDIATDRESKGLVGRQCNSITIEGKPDTPILSTYHSQHVTDVAYGTDVVSAVSGLGGYWGGMKLSTPEMLSGPEIRKRDHCWCGSGKRFKNCHLRKFGSVYANFPGFNSPLGWRVELGVDSARNIAAGSKFVISSLVD